MVITDYKLPSLKNWKMTLLECSTLITSELFDPLIVEYLRLSYVYPDIQEAGLLVRFRGSIREGKVTIVFPEDF